MSSPPSASSQIPSSPSTSSSPDPDTSQPHISGFLFPGIPSSQQIPHTPKMPRRPHRGLTYEEVKDCGIISNEERSSDFDALNLDEKDIKKLPRKLRGYYRHLATLKEHYEEVDSLLSGEIPMVIASSFKSPKGKRRHDGYEGLNPGIEDDPVEHEDARDRWRRSSSWQIQGSGKGKGKSDGSGKGRSQDEDEDGEAGEGTGLLDGQKREERRERIAKIALNVNTIVNIALVIAKGFAVLYSASISLTASLVDSALDLLSTLIILGTSWAIGMKTDRHRYPAGKRRFEPLGVLIFSVAMIASFVQVFIESFQRARAPSDEAPVDLSAIGIGTMVATIGIKLILWIWCSRIPSSGVQALAQDAENDVYFNLMSLAFPFAGSRLGFRLLDPIGGMVLSLYIIYEWVKTLLENFAKLSGKSAERDQITRVLYLVTRFNPVLEIGDVECYHIGDDLIVEVDVILPQSSTLHFAHDVGETIQCVLESLDGVLRAYVHCDYSSYNPLQHTTRQGPSSPVNGKATSTGSSGSATPTNNGNNKRPFFDGFERITETSATDSPGVVE